jgi:hypothetical protein
MHPLRLTRDYFFEFAGMPESGKSTVEEIVAHYLIRQGYVIEEFRGGSRFSPLRFSSIADLNVWIACKITEFVISALGREKATHKIFLLDRGLIDRCLFTNTLLRQLIIDENTANATNAFLTSSRLIHNIDGVFVFVTTPKLAIMRENKNKLVETEGGVMNKAFLTKMRFSIEQDFDWVRTLMPGKHVQLIDTSQHDEKETDTAQDILNTIFSIVSSSIRMNANV